MRKGEMTRAAIIDSALELASRKGLEGLTIGSLAENVKMSKSGVFAHFGSREDLQIEVLKRYGFLFEQEVFLPALREPRGLPRLRAMLNGWVSRVNREIATGCIFISGAVEYDDRPGPIRDKLLEMVETWQAALQRCVEQSIAQGHLSADTDARQVVFEIYGLVLALNHDARFMKRPNSTERAQNGFERILRDFAQSGSEPETKQIT
ncbi:MAG: TetR/AcrR family transcriptional regulator [Paucimonas sp.]|jgi:AcrR family transcriptional regulator|nr:TetR/AcrR family transcriptional regulator [Paucimonas sp.]